MAPMLAEEISCAGDGSNPDNGTQEVEESKDSPAHAQHSGQRSGEDAHAEDEAGKENAGRAIAVEHLLPALERGRRNSKKTSIAIEQGPPAIVAQGVAQVVAERGGTGGNHDDPAEMELVFGIGQKTRQQERGLAGDGKAGVLAEQCQSHGPVTVVGDECAQRVKNRVVHDEASSQFPVLSSQKRGFY